MLVKLKNILEIDDDYITSNLYKNRVYKVVAIKIDLESVNYILISDECNLLSCSSFLFNK
ncbi:hypothetical protein JXR93_14375 [bacterium]|nr:hypothetical protein [bacterium]